MRMVPAELDIAIKTSDCVYSIAWYYVPMYVYTRMGALALRVCTIRAMEGKQLVYMYLFAGSGC